MFARYISILALLVVAATSSGCATVTTGTNQSLSVETRLKGDMVSGASCKLNNDKGTWFVVTPGSVVVNRAYGDMTVSCTHDKHPSGVLVVKSTTKPMAFGNILIGGVIGAAVDVGTGSAYDYPALISLELGVNQLIPLPVTEDTPKKE